MLASAVGPSSHGAWNTRWSFAATAASPHSLAASTVAANRPSESSSSPNDTNGRWTPSSTRPCSHRAGVRETAPCVGEVTLLRPQHPNRDPPQRSSPSPNPPTRSCMKLPLGRSAVLLTTAVATLAVSLPSTALADSNSKVKEYSLDQYAVPADLTTGPDGALYAPDGSLDRLWRVTTKGKVCPSQLGGSPGRRGHRQGRRSVGHGPRRRPDPPRDHEGPDHQPTSCRRTRPASAPSRPTSSPAPTAPCGSSRRTATRSAASRPRATSRSTLPTAGAFASDITVGPDGALWFTESIGDKVGRITTKGGKITEYPPRRPAPSPLGSSAAVTARSTSPRPTPTPSPA